MIVKIVEVVSTSEKSWEDAAQNAINDAAKTVRHITGIDVVGFTAQVRDEKITEYKANVKIALN